MVIDRPAPRPPWLRWILTVLIVAVVIVVPWTLSELTRDPQTGRAIPPTVALLVFGLLVAGRVAYRWFDAFLLMIPFLGLFFLWRFAWRLAALPHRDWPPRPGERPQPGGLRTSQR